MQPLLLCTDLDRTLLPNGAEPESSGARQRFSALAARNDVHLVYVTGRHRALVQKAITCYALPEPDLVISDVGTCIYDLRGGDWEHWPDWDEEIAPDWAGMAHADMHALFADIDALRLQEREKQNTHKLSYYVALHEDEQALMRIMEQRLEQRYIKASLIWSIDEPAAVGLLDVLPRSATKLHAIEFLRERLGYGRERTLFAGDSGNDLPVLASPLRAILVANATEAVRTTALEAAARAGHADALYIASGGFLGMNGYYSAGILEGVDHYEPKLGAWLGGHGEQTHVGD